MPGYRRTKNVDAGKMMKGSTSPMAGAEKMPMGDGPMHNAAGKVNKPTESRRGAMARLASALRQLRQRRTSMAAGKGTTQPTTGGY